MELGYSIVFSTGLPLCSLEIGSRRAMMISTIRDRMTNDFVQLNVEESVAKAHAALKERDGLHGVILDKD